MTTSPVRGASPVRRRVVAGVATIVLALAALCAGPRAGVSQGSSSSASDAARREVLALDARRAAAFVAGAPAFLARVTPAAYTHVETRGVSRHNAEFMNERRRGEPRFARFDIEVNEARVFGDVAVVTGRYTNQVETAAGLQPAKRARHLRVYVRQSGEWRVVAHQATEIANPSSERPDERGQTRPTERKDME